jgi:hypothetical protein
MVSNLDPVSMFFFALSLFNNYLGTSAKRLCGSIINVHTNYDDFLHWDALNHPDMEGNHCMGQNNLGTTIIPLPAWTLLDTL